MAGFSKLEMLSILKQYFNGGGQFYRKISKFGYFTNFQIILKICAFCDRIMKLEVGIWKFWTFAFEY